MQSSDDIQILEEFTQRSSSPDIILLPSPKSSNSWSSTTVIKKEPLKFIIKRLQQPTTSSRIKYKLHTVAASPQLKT